MQIIRGYAPANLVEKWAYQLEHKTHLSPGIRFNKIAPDSTYWLEECTDGGDMTGRIVEVTVTETTFGRYISPVRILWSI